MAPAAAPAWSGTTPAHSDLIKVWDHKIRLEDFHGMTRYTDEVEVHAGPLTAAASLFAIAPSTPTGSGG